MCRCIDNNRYIYVRCIHMQMITYLKEHFNKKR
jgi:hypothetical protein